MTQMSSKSNSPLRISEASWIIAGQIRADFSSEGARARALINQHDLMDDRTAVAFIAGLDPRYDGILCEVLKRADDPAFALNEFARQYENHLHVTIDWVGLAHDSR